MRKSLVSLVALGLFLGAPALADMATAQTTNQTATTQQQSSSLSTEQFEQMLADYEARSEIKAHIIRAITPEGVHVLALVGPRNLEPNASPAAQDSDVRDRFEEGRFSDVVILGEPRIYRADFDEDHYIFALSADEMLRYGVQTGSVSGGTGAQSGTQSGSTTMGQTGTQSGTQTSTQSGTQTGQTDTQSGTQTGAQSGTQMGQTDTQSGTQTGTQSGTQMGQTDTQSGTQTGTQSGTKMGQTDTESDSDADSTTMSQTDTQTGTQSGSTTMSQTDTQTGTQSGSSAQSGSTTMSQTDTGQAARALSEPDAERIVSQLEEAGLEEAKEFKGRLVRATSNDSPVFFIITPKDMESGASVDVSEEDLRSKLQGSDLEDIQFIDNAKIVRGNYNDDQIFVLAGDLFGQNQQQ